MSTVWMTQTRPADIVWRKDVRGYRGWETTVILEIGPEAWSWATREVLRWGVKTRSGFSVTPDTIVVAGMRPVIVARTLGLSIREPVEVIDVVETPDRVGFAYRTLPGHPVSGEEALIVHRDDDHVLLTIRSLTRPSDTLRWRVAYPVLLLAQAAARHRYRRALRIRTDHSATGVRAQP